jgi:transcription initiation factor IIE alpha subunit
VDCFYCDTEMERVPYPRGEKHICPECGNQVMDSDAMDYYREQREQVHSLMEQINKASEEH